MPFDIFNYGKTEAKSVLGDMLKLNKACIDIMEICIAAENNETTDATAVKEIRQILIAMAFSLDIKK